MNNNFINSLVNEQSKVGQYLAAAEKELNSLKIEGLSSQLTSIQNTFKEIVELEKNTKNRIESIYQKRDQLYSNLITTMIANFYCRKISEKIAEFQTRLTASNYLSDSSTTLDEILTDMSISLSAYSASLPTGAIALTYTPEVKAEFEKLESVDELSKLAKLEKALNEQIIGQTDATHLVANAVKRSRVKTSALRRPASFIFVGPTGVGKTALVKALSEQLFDTPETLIRLDMSEFMEKHSVSRLIGAPPGYVGYDEAGQLTEKVRRKPYSVILVDEIEKAHPDVLNILLQILDEGRVTDAHGRNINFENTIIVMTSNAGSERSDNLLGFGKTVADASKDKALKALREFLRPEFIARVDEIVVFNPLSIDSLQKIAEIMLNELANALKERNIVFVFDDLVAKYIAEKCDGTKTGARELRNIIRRDIETPVVDMIISAKTVQKIVTTIVKGELSINIG